MMRYDHVEGVQGMTTMIIENEMSQAMLLLSSELGDQSTSEAHSHYRLDYLGIVNLNILSMACIRT
ncbi:hypothetical protein F383_06655 [Gossypium arboreum]|uniref:Uncharacterized protein n=1 Tax=Gossypium arboreum TaxID=29729 RepID=A0A0B0P0B9_GOSAR|nr:hypothetical protein F383_06655 [Gossypium arboreum]